MVQATEPGEEYASQRLQHPLPGGSLSDTSHFAELTTYGFSQIDASHHGRLAD